MVVLSSLFILTFIVSLVSSAFLDKRDSKEEPNGSPGNVCYADAYNNLGNNWNRTYGPYEAQQIYLALTDDAETARVQFATLNEIEKSVLQYWPIKHPKKSVTVYGKDWTFVDGGVAQRKLYLHQLQTKKLQPATIYAYQVGSIQSNSKKIQWSKQYEFHTAPKTKHFNFLATGDIGACNAVAVSHLMAYAKTHKYDFITVGGDQAYNMDDFNGTKGDEYMNFMQDLYAQVPYMGAVGNHEGAYNFSHYKNRFDSVPHTESKFVNSLMYSVNYKSLHVVSFSTEVYFTGTPNEIRTAVNWLEADLTQANKDRAERPWIIFLTHHPIYCSVDSTDCTTKANTIKYGLVDASTNQTLSGIEDILIKHKVDIYLSGHVHNYERTYPVANGKLVSKSYHNAPSFFQLVIGNAGQPEGPSAFGNGPFPDWSAKRYGSFGFSTFKVSPTSLHMVHRQANTDGSLGGIIDELVVTKDKIRKHKRSDDCVSY